MRFYTIRNFDLSVGMPVFHWPPNGRSVTDVVCQMQENRELPTDTDSAVIIEYHDMATIYATGNVKIIDGASVNAANGFIVSSFWPVVLLLGIGDSITIQHNGRMNTYTHESGKGVVSQY